METDMTVKYLVVAPATRQNEVVNLFMKTFPDSVKDISRCPFPIDKIYCYMYIDDYLESAQLIIRANTLTDGKPIDAELLIYQDMETIPLMNKALADSRSYKGD